MCQIKRYFGEILKQCILPPGASWEPSTATTSSASRLLATSPAAAAAALASASQSTQSSTSALNRNGVGGPMRFSAKSNR